MRQVLAVAVGAVVAAAGAVILGEYDLSGLTALYSAALFGVAIAEVVASVAHHSDWFLAAAVGLLTEAGFVWALWISNGHHLDLASVTGWFGVALGMAAAGAWISSAGQRGRSKPAAT